MKVKSVTRLPGVRTIGIIDCEMLQRNVCLSGIVGTPVAILTPITPVTFFGEAECSCKTIKESGKLTDNATLKFRSSELLPLERHIGFVVTDNNGDTWLIGSKEPPYPKLTAEIGMGRCSGDAAGYNYEVTHEAIKTLIPCKV